MSGPGGAAAMHLCCIMVHHRTPGLALDALEALAPQLEVGRDLVLVVDDASGDDSADRIEQACAARGFGRICRVLREPRRVGRAAAYNAGIRAGDADFYLLLRSHTLLREHALAELFTELQHYAGAGIVGPRLEAPDGSALPSCFRDRSPLGEWLAAAPQPIPEQPRDVDWLSFSCALLRRAVIDQVGLLDEGYFEHFEDGDYCRAARGAGFRVRYCPRARAVALEPEGAELGRRPRHYYASRARYFRKGYGLSGLWRANALWQLGRSLPFGTRGAAPREREWFDNWTDAFKPQR
jgi:N-acetylglucosaminyl-diphospho-decaprenol L-rhamnosyltransferase